MGVVKQKKKTGELRPERILAGGFLALILLGTVLLCLPVATVTGQPLSVFDSLFTATSAVCVTGLVAVDTGTTFSFFGQAVLLVLIQVGGLGFMVFATLIMSMLGHRITLRERMVLRESMNTSSLSGLVRLTGLYGLIALLIELAGACLLAIRFIPMYGVGKGIWYSVFHAVSAFCNAGFDLNGGFSSLTSFHADPLVLLTASLMVILGGLGFPVEFELVRNRFRWSRLTLHARVVLILTGSLLLLGTVFFALAEWNNPGTLAAHDAGWAEKLLNAFFQSVTMRTAGFNSVDLQAMTSGSKLFSSVLMFIGASPASTGGGAKTTTIAALLLLVWATVRGNREVTLMGRRLPMELLHRAVAILMISLTVLLCACIALALIEQDGVPLIDLLFETASAVATVGVSAHGTPGLHLASRALIIPLMYFGRVGPLTLALALANRQAKDRANVKYPEESIMIG